MWSDLDLIRKWAWLRVEGFYFWNVRSTYITILGKSKKKQNMIAGKVLNQLICGPFYRVKSDWEIKTESDKWALYCCPSSSTWNENPLFGCLFHAAGSESQHVEAFWQKKKEKKSAPAIRICICTHSEHANCSSCIYYRPSKKAERYVIKQGCPILGPGCVEAAFHFSQAGASPDLGFWLGWYEILHPHGFFWIRLDSYSA